MAVSRKSNGSFLPLNIGAVYHSLVLNCLFRLSDWDANKKIISTNLSLPKHQDCSRH